MLIITNLFVYYQTKKRILGVTVVYDFLASTPVPRTPHNRLRAGPNVKTKDWFGLLLFGL